MTRVGLFAARAVPTGDGVEDDVEGRGDGNTRPVEVRVLETDLALAVDEDVFR